MALTDIMTIASTGMSAQSVRLSISASNLANANTVASSDEGAFRAFEPVFKPLENRTSHPFANAFQDAITQGVHVSDIQKSTRPIEVEYLPGNPEADENGYVHKSNVNSTIEMTNIVEASRDYDRNIQVMLTAKKLIEHTLKLAE